MFRIGETLLLAYHDFDSGSDLQEAAGSGRKRFGGSFWGSSANWTRRRRSRVREDLGA